MKVYVVYAGGCIRVYAYGWYAGYTQGKVHRYTHMKVHVVSAGESIRVYAHG